MNYEVKLKAFSCGRRFYLWSYLKHLLKVITFSWNLNYCMKSQLANSTFGWNEYIINLKKFTFTNEERNSCRKGRRKQTQQLYDKREDSISSKNWEITVRNLVHMKHSKLLPVFSDYITTSRKWNYIIQCELYPKRKHKCYVTLSTVIWYLNFLECIFSLPHSSVSIWKILYG
jgi:hypothetical protein